MSTPVTAFRARNAYQRVDAESRSPLELVVMLYDGFLKFVLEAKDGIERDDLVTRARGVSKALAIVSELQNTLNMDAGGEMSAQLDELYTYVKGRLLDVTRTGDAAPLDEVHKLMATLREGWAQIAAQGRP